MAFENSLAVSGEGAKTLPVVKKNKKTMRFGKTMQKYRTERAAQDTSTHIWHLGFISRCTAYSVRWIAFRCCVSVRWIAFGCCVSVRWIACIALLPWNFAVEL